jgi:hypothetical protein
MLHLWGHRYTGIISRCYNTDSRAYKNYGGRGITVYEPWKNDRREFFRFAKTLEGWDNPKLDIDRIDNNAGYFPDNIRLVSRKENSNNKRNTSYVEYRGGKYTYEAFWKKFCPKWSRNAAWWHFKRGKTAEYAVDYYRTTREGVRSDELWAYAEIFD